MSQFAVVTARMPQYVQQERFDAGSMEVRLFDTQDDATEWAVLNPEYICEVVPVTETAKVSKHSNDPGERQFMDCGDECVSQRRHTYNTKCILWQQDHPGTGAGSHDRYPV